MVIKSAAIPNLSVILMHSPSKPPMIRIQEHTAYSSTGSPIRTARLIASAVIVQAA